MGKNKRGWTCTICGQEGLKPYFSLDDYAYYRCPACDLIQMRPLPESLGPGDDYLGYDLERHREFVRLFLVPRYRKAIELIQRYGPGKQLLDIGCGTGEFLDEAAKAGFSVFGIEPSKTAFLVARKEHSVVRGELKDIGLEPSSFDVVTLWSVLEHVLDPLSLLHKVRLVLKGGGLLALSLPSSRGLLPLVARCLYRVSGGKIRRPLVIVYQLDWHYKHFYFYNRKNLAILLKKCGFEILRQEGEASFDLPSLDLRMDYLPPSSGLRLLFKAALFVLLQVSQLLGRQDEIIALARKKF